MNQFKTTLVTDKLIVCITIMVLHSENGWLGTSYLKLYGWELEVTHKLELRGSAVPCMLL